MEIEEVLRINLQALKLQLKLLDLVGSNMEGAWKRVLEEVRQLAFKDPQRIARLNVVMSLLQEAWLEAKKEKPDKKKLEELIREAEIWLEGEKVEA